jgi:hypothetical protein
MSHTIQLHSIKCVREINEDSASEEPYVLVTAVQLRKTLPNFPSIQNVRVFRYGVWENFDEGEVKTNSGPAFWGLNSTPEDITDPSEIDFIISLMENDNGDPGQYQTFLEATTSALLALTLGEQDRSVRFARLVAGIRNALNGIDLPVPFVLDDDHIGTEELRLDSSDLIPVDAGTKNKLLTIQSDEGHYELTFQIIKGFPNWRQLDNNPMSIAIVGDADDLYQLHNSGRIFKFSGTPLTGWQELDNNPSTKKIVAAGGNLYQIHQGGLIWKFTGIPLTGWQQLDNNPASIDIIADGNELYQFHNNGSIFKFLGVPLTGWQALDNNPATKRIVAAGGNLYQIHQNGFIWKFTGTPLTGWQQLDNNPASIDILADGNDLYQLHNNGRIFKFLGTPFTGWQELDNNASTKKIAAAGGNLYQIHQNGFIWKFTGTPLTGWQQLDNNLASLDIVAAGNNLYQIHSNGLIWHHIPE